MVHDELANIDQVAYWDGSASASWVADQERYDEMFAPITTRLMAAAKVRPGQAVLDVGCGCGETTMLAGWAAVPAGRAHGVDLSRPMLGYAAHRADAEGIGSVTFEWADAQTADLGGPYDRIISRFGTMFFADPVAAFANLASVLERDGKLVFACWQDVLANAWMVVPGAAAVEAAGLTTLGEEAIRPFSLADPEAIRSTLALAGFGRVDVQACVTPVLLGGSGTVEEAVDFVSRSSTGHLVLDGVGDDVRQRALDAVRSSLAPFHDGEGVRLDAAAWIVTGERRR